MQPVTQQKAAGGVETPVEAPPRAGAVLFALRLRLTVLGGLAAAPLLGLLIWPAHLATGNTLLLAIIASIVGCALAAEFLFMRPWRHLSAPLSTGAEPISVSAIADISAALPELALIAARIRSLEEQLRQASIDRELAEVRHGLLDTHSRDMVAVVDLDLTYRQLSSACEKLFGCPGGEFVGNHCLDNIHPDDRGELDRLFQELHAGKQSVQRSCTGRKRDGRWVALDWMAQRWNHPGSGTLLGFVLLVRDVSSQKMAEERLAEANKRLQSLETSDALTGLPNRRVFDETLRKEWRLAVRVPAPLSLLFVDIDHFKLYNEHYGAAAGDDCLRRVARILQEAVRRPGDIAARYGDAAFAIFLPHTGDVGAQALAEKLMAAVAEAALPHKLSAFNVVTLSIGMTTMTPRSEIDENTLVARAHRSLQAAKKAGANCIRQDSQATTLLLDISARR